MRRSHTLTRTAPALVGALLMLSGCSTPQHTNTLIFGTSTRLAIDVSQEPTGSFGATIGYKRHEAVWMPLLANEKLGNTTEPAECKSDSCKEFVGEAGRGGGAAGPGAKDTYSVLATFSGDMSGSAQNAQARAGVAQYFATGIAARLLAQYGGAAAVGAPASAPTSAAISAAATSLNKTHNDQVTTIGARLSKTDGTLKADVVQKLFTLDPAKTVAAQDRNAIIKLKTRSELQSHLSDAPEDVTRKIFDTLDQI